MCIRDSFTRFTNVSPSGRIAFAVPGDTTPRITPSVIATRTRKVRLLRRRRIEDGNGEPGTGALYRDRDHPDREARFPVPRSRFPLGTSRSTCFVSLSTRGREKTSGKYLSLP